jgi:effector-binding domain-containing protein
MGKFQVDQPNIVKTVAQKTAVVHIITPRERIRSVLGAGYRELMETISKQGIKPTGPWFTHHLRVDPDIFDLEIGVPVPTVISPDGRVIASELPATTVVRTIYHGDYERLEDAWAEFDQWVTANGYQLEESFFETYLVGPEASTDPDQWQTELKRKLLSTSIRLETMSSV